MKTFNHTYSSAQGLKIFLLEKNIQDAKDILIQVFISTNDSNKMKTILENINTLLPSAKVIATSTAGEIIDGAMKDGATIVSISLFEKTNIEVKLIEGKNEEDIARKISDLINAQSKLLIMFNNVYVNDGEKILNYLESSNAEIMIAGGNAGDDGSFGAQTVVGANNMVSTTGVAVAILNSDELKVHNSYLLNWQTIGEFMYVTRADGNIIYEIDHQSVQDVYRNYLGDDIADSLPGSGVEFPLIFSEDGIEIARAPVAVGENGSLIMAGDIPEGTKVQFGFGDVAQNDKEMITEIEKFSKLPVESIFIYSCSARKYFLKDHLNSEFELLQRIAPTSGFITYGEFFKQAKCNKMLNVTSTFIGLSESSSSIHEINIKKRPVSNHTRTLNALSHLVKQTTKHLYDNLHDLMEFKNILKSSSIYSTTDLKGIITDVNERFCDISGYSRGELIGSPHKIVRHKDVPKSTYEQLWKTIQSKKSWHGIVKNRAKDGSVYYVRAHIYPILDAQKNILEYVSLRDDITEEIEKQNRLEGDFNQLEERSTEKTFLLNQYEKIIDQNSAFVRMNPSFNLLYANEVFCDIYKCEARKIMTNNITDFIDPRYFVENFPIIREALATKGTWKSVVPFRRVDNVLIYMDTKINAVYNIEHKLVEYMVALQDVTDLIMLQKEMEETQKDVVYTMGAIGETRSKETGNHVKRVAEYSKILALHYGVELDKAELLKMASPMHDIGKVGIPDAILNKPGKLDEKEWIIMKTHSTLGYQMLKNSKREILQAAAIVALTHHEKWDGTGYPEGLSGEDIHVYGRITAVADVFDALGSDRCYKKAWEDEKIFALLRDERSKHFDPKLIDIFFDNLAEFLAVRDKFRD